MIKTIILHDLKFYIKNQIEAIQTIGLFISILFLLPFGQSVFSFDYHMLAPGILCASLILAVSAGSHGLFQRDEGAGLLEAYRATSIVAEKIVLAKWLAFILALILPLTLMLPAAFLMLNIGTAEWPRYAVGGLWVIIDASLLAALASVLIMGIQKVGALLTLVIVPLAIPIVIFGSDYIRASDSASISSLIFLIGFALFFIPLLMVVGASCIKNSH